MFELPAHLKRLLDYHYDRRQRAQTTDRDWTTVYAKTYRDGTTCSLRLEDALLQVITHDTHHRGQVLVLARQLGYTPPDLDFL